MKRKDNRKRKKTQTRVKSPKAKREQAMRALPIDEMRFRAVMAGTDVPKTKPAPDVYRRAVQELRVTSANCIAVEDSATGVAAAKAAGLRVIAVPNRFTWRQDLSRADARVERLKQVLVLL